MKTSEILDRAIEHMLFNGYGEQDGKCEFSCSAVINASKNTRDAYDAIDFLETLGVDQGLPEFREFKEGPERQYARALWLTFAAHYARELEAEGEL